MKAGINRRHIKFQLQRKEKVRNQPSPTKSDSSDEYLNPFKTKPEKKRPKSNKYFCIHPGCIYMGSNKKKVTAHVQMKHIQLYQNYVQYRKLGV